MDEFMLQLTSKRKTSKNFAGPRFNLLKKTPDVTSPLAKLLQSLEQTKREGENLTVVLKDLLRFCPTKCTPCWINQYSRLHHRRLNVLGGVMNNLLPAKSMLKKSELLQKEEKYLFGKELREEISETLKA